MPLDTTMTREPDASLDWMRQIQRQQRENESANGVLRNIYKRAKSAGENVAIMRRVIRKLRSSSPEEIIADLEAEIYYLRLRNVEVTSQALFHDLDLYITETGTAAEAMFAAQEKGYQAGRLGQKIEENPYQPGTELHVGWIEHWKRGQEAIAMEMGPEGKVADGGRQRPSRRARQQTLPGTEDTNVVKLDGKRPKRGQKAPAKKAAARKDGGRKKAAQADASLH